MSDVTQAEREWVGRVLGVTLTASDDGRGDDFAKLWPSIRAVWQQASEQVDRQIGQLQHLLRDAADKRLQTIAATGLNAMTAGYKSRMLAAVHDMDRASGTEQPAMAARVAKAAIALRNHLLTDKRVAACDACPHLTITIRQTLGDALANMAHALTRGGGTSLQ
jgi:hypothetical protein